MKKVCFVNTTKFWGGGEKWHYQNAVAMSKYGFEVSFILNEAGELKGKISEAGINHYEVDITPFSYFNYFKNKKIANYLIKRNIEVVIVNDSRDLKTISMICKKLKIRVIYRRGIARPVKWTNANRFIYTALVSDIIFNSEATKKAFFKNIDESLIPTKKHIIYNSLEIEKFPNGQNEMDKIVIGNASRLTEQKGLNYIIELAELLKSENINAIIKIAGKGELEQELLSEIKEKNLNNYVQLVGFYDDIHEFLSELDIYLCSSEFEGFGYSIAEAMLHELPVVGFDISSNPEVIRNNETGILVTPFNILELKEAIIRLIDNDDIRKSYGIAGYKYVSDNFNKEKSYKKLIEVINQ
ncbi:MAG: glycosyltransferase family 4 protein [Chlorobiota bacterium]